ncbi:MAG: 2-polyprenylphenol 6-hydroxylase [Alphaproteobacteria bacterium]|nr:2-polyprenylphenol 6-hydroxylase [Alphaproteobacteria bacterium]
MIRTIRNLWRLMRIGLVLARYDSLILLEMTAVTQGLALPLRLFRRKLPGRPGERLAVALRELGPTFIKLGQALSTRPDLVGEEMAADLSELQDSLPAFAAAAARQIVETELDRPISELFQRFDEMPVAAASIAQVHRATTIEGEDVAVKVLRPGVEEAFARDIELLYWLAEIAEFTQPGLRRLKPVETVRTFEDSVALEMDLRFEAAASAEMAENFEGDGTFRIPGVDWQRTARRVLTTQWVNGIPIGERDRLIEAGIDLKSVVEIAADAFFNQVFRDGFFHADMHPGNLFVDRDGNVVAVDFGITGRIDHRMRRYLGEMLLSFLTGNYRRVAEVHFEVGFVPPDKSIDAFTQACRSIAEPIMGRPLNEISVARLLGQLFEVTEAFSMQTQPELLLLQKSMLVTEGVGRLLYPEVNMWQLAHPLIEHYMRDILGPEARVRETVGNVLSSLERLPRLIADAERTGLMAAGGLRLHPDSLKALGGGRRPMPLGMLLPWILVGVLLTVLLAR